jgi:hypothetical protein
MPKKLAIRSFSQKGKNLNIANYRPLNGVGDRKILPEND